jgi:hypothetical protein
VLLSGCEPESRKQNVVNRAGKSDPLPIVVAKADARALQPLSGETSVSGIIPEPAVEQDAAALLAQFHADLRDLADGKRTRPVTILHFGDDHVAADRLPGELRKLFQSRFGDAGRGLVMPAGVYRNHRADGVRFGLEGNWRAELITTVPEGGFGLTGARVVATAKGDRMTIEAEDGFDTAEVAFAGGPASGRARIAFDGQVSEVSTRRATTQLVRIATQRPGKRIEITALQNRGIAIAGITFGRNKPGVRYIGLGLPGADIGALAGLDQALAGEELRRTAPSLVILGFGTAAGFDNDLDLAQYEATAQSLVRRIRSWSPTTAIVIAGPPDAVTLPDYAASSARSSGETACRAIGPNETGGYRDGLAAADPRLARWHPPINLASVRAVWRRVAGAEGVLFWDWHGLMGGDCSIHAWAYADPPLAQRDHNLLTADGYQRSADALFQRLLTGLQSQAATPPEPVEAAASQ